MAGKENQLCQRWSLMNLSLRAFVDVSKHFANTASLLCYWHNKLGTAELLIITVTNHEFSNYPSISTYDCFSRNKCTAQLVFLLKCPSLVWSIFSCNVKQYAKWVGIFYEWVWLNYSSFKTDTLRHAVLSQTPLWHTVTFRSFNFIHCPLPEITVKNFKSLSKILVD